MMDADPRSQVEAPVRGALVGVIGRGLALVATMALLALWPIVVRPSMLVRDAIAIVALGVLLGYATWSWGVQRFRARPSDEDLATAWSRAREIDRDDATLSLFFAGWVPVAVLVAIVLLLWPHCTDRNPGLAAAWVVLGMPAFAIAWLFTTVSWLEACRHDLARAEREADARLRRYWSNVGH